MTLHVAASNWLAVSVRSFEWQVLNFYDAVARCGVPIFVMISGALFLNPDKNIPIRKIYFKYILRIIIVFVFWSFVYAARGYIKNGDIMKAAANFVRGHYHLWFLYMITGLYMIIPFVRRIAVSETLTKYFLVLALIFTYLLPECASIISVFSKKCADLIQNVLSTKLHMHFVAGYTGYFLLGYFLDRTAISHKAERIIYLAGIIGVSMTILMSGFASFLKNEPKVFYGNLTVNVLCESIAVFVFFRRHFTCNNSVVLKLSQYSLGAYLVHPIFISLLRKIGLNSLTFNPVFSVPVIAVIVFIISFIISAVLNHIPVLKKYIV